jgi:hypothetical protein
MIKAPCTRCGAMHTHLGMLVLTNGPLCKKCLRTGYWPPGAHLAVGAEFEEIYSRLFGKWPHGP